MEPARPDMTERVRTAREGAERWEDKNRTRPRMCAGLASAPAFGRKIADLTSCRLRQRGTPVRTRCCGQLLCAWGDMRHATHGGSAARCSHTRNMWH